MKKLTVIIRYILGLMLILVGLITIILEEPLYGSGFIILAILLIPITSKLLKKISPNLFSSKSKKGVFISISLLIVISISLFGRKKYNKVENINEKELATLSIHSIYHTKINALDYYYIEEGEGETIILLHGFPDMANTWDETITELSKTHRVIAPFLRGYYPTGIPENMDFSVKAIADDMIQLVGKLSIDKFTVIGHDWGASISYAMANLSPDKVEKIVSISIPHPASLKPTFEFLYAARHFLIFQTGSYGVRYTRKDNFEFIDRLYQRLSPDYTEFKKSSDAIKETFKFPNRLEAALGYYKSFGIDQKSPAKMTFYAELPKVPVLFMAGENDNFVTEENLNAMRNKMPKGSKTIVFKNSGHYLHREIFTEYFLELKSFLTSKN